MNKNLFLILAAGALAYYFMIKKKSKAPKEERSESYTPDTYGNMTYDEKVSSGLVTPVDAVGVDMAGESPDVTPDNTVTKSLPLDGDEVEPVKLPEVKMQPVRKVEQVKDSAPPRKVIDKEMGMSLTPATVGSAITEPEPTKIVAKKPVKVVKKPEPIIPNTQPMRVIREPEPVTIRSTNRIGRPPVIEKLPTKNELTFLRPALPQELQVRGGRLPQPKSSLFGGSMPKLRF